jgi:hypothetical protein
VLRRVAPRSWIWLPANAVAWAAGMPIIFAAIDQAGKAGAVGGAVAVVVVSLAVTGAVVGAIHGLAVVALARPTVAPGEV